MRVFGTILGHLLSQWGNRGTRMVSSSRNFQSIIGLASSAWIAISLVFNVGYFSVVGLEFYSAFTISDHITSFLRTLSYFPYILLPYAFFNWIHTFDWYVTSRAEGTGEDPVKLKRLYKSFDFNFRVMGYQHTLFLFFGMLLLAHSLLEIIAYICLIIWLLWLVRTQS